MKNIHLKLLGKHNVLNAAAAIAVCLNLGVNQNIIKKSLKSFSGVQRRMTKIFTKNFNDFYDDYAHHPTEISSILDGVKNVYKDRKIISVFEPHRYSRVNALKNEFASSFREIDTVVLCPVHSNYKQWLTRLIEIKMLKLVLTNSCILWDNPQCTKLTKS